MYKEREREREREPRSCLQRRSCLWLRWSTNRFTNPRIDHRSRAFNPQALDFAGNPEPLRHEPTNWSLCVILIFCVILIDPRTDLRFCDFEFLLFLWSLIFFIVGVVVWVVVFWWFSCCVVVGFVWVVVENSIFKILPNTWKYFLEQFS